MSKALHSEIRNFVHERISLSLQGNSHGDIADNSNLIESGILDSMGFVSIIVAVEEKYQISADFEDADPEAFLTVGGLVEIVVSQIERSVA